ncbi:hypothetical protein IV102_20890 [bacterium]|nr:hypothetical protein [bacterium]
MRVNPIRPIPTLILAGLVATAVWAAPGPTEKSVDLKAADLLPASIVAGTNSQVLDPVENDGYLNIYRLNSKNGELKVVSTATLYERAHEFDMMAQMDKLKGSQEFTKAVGGQVDKVVTGGVNLVTDPIGTTKKAFSGLGRMFQSIGDTLGGGGSADDNLIGEASGFDKVKRSYAKEFKVDPYSRNPYLQEKLKDISRAGFLGGTVTSLGLGAVGGAAGMALNVASTTNSLGEMVTGKSPQDVAQYNSDTLHKIGVDDDMADLFLRNKNYTATERTAIVMALDSMPQTKNRQDFIKFAVLTDNADVASFRRRQADLYAAYDQKQAHIQEFRFLDPFAAALLEDGSVLLMAPVDHLLWTGEIATYVARVNQQLSAQATPRKMLWLSGSVSPLALQSLKQSGWQVQPKAADRLK